jgi:hypothetical protein
MGVYTMRYKRDYAKIYIIILTIITLLSTLTTYDTSKSQTIDGIKPFIISISHYHINGVNVNGRDIPIGKKINVVEFDGSNFKITRMGIIKKNGNELTHGPILNKYGEQTYVNFSGDNYLETMSDIFSTFYKYEFIGNQSVAFSFHTNKRIDVVNHSLYFDISNPTWYKISTQVTKPNNKVDSSFSLLDESMQYQYYEVVNKSLISKYRYAINPDKYNKELPLLEGQVNLFPKYSKYLLLEKENRRIVVGGVDQYYEPYVLISRDNKYYISTQRISSFLGVAVKHDKEQHKWIFMKIYNPDINTLSLTELVLNENDPAYVIVNGKKIKLDNNWIRITNSSCPYITLSEYCSIFRIKYYYRYIDKSVLLPLQ